MSFSRIFGIYLFSFCNVSIQHGLGSSLLLKCGSRNTQIAMSATLKQDYHLNLFQNRLRDFWQWHHAAQRDTLGRADNGLKYWLFPLASLPKHDHPFCGAKDRASYLPALQLILFHSARRAGLSKSFWTLRLSSRVFTILRICVICKFDERALRAGQMLDNCELIDWLIDTPKIKPPTPSLLGHNSEP